MWPDLYRSKSYVRILVRDESDVCTVEVDGDGDDTRVLIVTNKGLTISSIHCTRRLNRRRTRAVAPVYAPAT